jgi:hypothetical protein
VVASRLLLFRGNLLMPLLFSTRWLYGKCGCLLLLDFMLVTKFKSKAGLCSTLNSCNASRD